MFFAINKRNNNNPAHTKHCQIYICFKEIQDQAVALFAVSCTRVEQGGDLRAKTQQDVGKKNTKVFLERQLVEEVLVNLITLRSRG